MSSLPNSTVARPLVTTTNHAGAPVRPRHRRSVYPDMHRPQVDWCVMDPRQLYTLNEAVVAKLKDHRPVLIHQLDGFRRRRAGWPAVLRELAGEPRA